MYWSEIKCLSTCVRQTENVFFVGIAEGVCVSVTVGVYNIDLGLRELSSQFLLKGPDRWSHDTLLQSSATDLQSTLIVKTYAF